MTGGQGLVIYALMSAFRTLLGVKRTWVGVLHMSAPDQSGHRQFSHELHLHLASLKVVNFEQT